MKTFDQQFLEVIDQIEADAKSVGSNMTQVCHETGISRTTPDRWRNNPPNTIQLVSEMQRVVAAKIAAKRAISEQIAELAASRDARESGKE